MRGCHSCKDDKLVTADIALVGNPNTGKSCLFTQLTGINTIISNYAGTTVDIQSGKFSFKGKTYVLVDLPGTYSLGSATDEQKAATGYIFNKKPKVIVNVVDSTLLERNLYLTLQLLELKIPIVIALNFCEECADKGKSIDPEKLSSILGVPVVSIDALRGAGIKELMDKAMEAYDGNLPFKYYSMKYDDHIEKAIDKISPLIRREWIPKRASAVGLIEEKDEGSDEYKKVKKVIDSLSTEHALGTEISRERHGQAALIAEKVIKLGKVKKSFKEYLDRFTTERATGILSMFVVLAIIFSSLFFLGGWLSTLFGALFEKFILGPLNPLIEKIPSELAVQMIKWGLDGINAALQIALPYIAVFYILLALLEDSGYLPRMAYILDRITHKLHLHGKAIVPMMLGFGCSVPAILSTRILPSRKERILTSILISLVPCSARTAVILGSVGAFIGPMYALLIYLIILLLIFTVGFVLGRLLPGESQGLILEMPEYRIPYLKNVFIKTWLRVKDFVTIAFPLIIIGSMALGV
ncbi:MAG TPA: ferrous iron transport protein B, partial [Candidatus Nanoarchaeia archaeon]|nr:ferrous iron transport protein B [Candidatus Nanoarchaeia archaeon]